MNFLKYFFVLSFLALFLGCSSEDNSNDAGNSNGIKYIKTVSDKLGYLENWIYDDQNRVVKILYSDDRMTMFEYDNEGRVIKANTFLRSAPGIKTMAYQIEYQQNLITFTVSALGSNSVNTRQSKYILDETGKPIKVIFDEGILENVFIRSGGNVISISGFTPHKYTYDDKKNLYYYYPIGLRLVISDDLFNDNNIISEQKLNQEYIYQYKYEYDKDGYITKGQYTYTY